MNIAYEMLLAAKACFDRQTSLPPNFKEELEKMTKAGEEYAKSEAEMKQWLNAFKILCPLDYERMLTPEVELKKRLKRKKARNKKRNR